MTDLVKYFNVIRKWWWIIALLFVVTMGTILILPRLAETQYEATVTVQVSAPPPEETPLYSDFGRGVMTEQIEQARLSFNQVLMSDVINRTLKQLPDIRMSAHELREYITVELPKDATQLVIIHVRSSDPETAALLANMLVEVGLQQYGQLRAKSTVNARQFIEQQLEVVGEDLKTAEAELVQFQIANKIGQLQSAMNRQYEDIRTLRNTRDLSWVEGNVTKAEAIDKILLERETDLQNLIGLSAEYNDLVDDVDRLRSTYNFLLERKSEAQIKENQLLEVGYIQIINPAYPPDDPVVLIDNNLILLGGIASLLVGGLLAFLLEYWEVSRTSHVVRPRPERSEVVA